MAYIIVGCEESQAVTKAFRALGHEAFSCDLKECSGGRDEWHIKGDIFNVLEPQETKFGKLIIFTTQDGAEHVIPNKWDLGVFFPDCTFLTCSAEWAYKEPPYHQKVKPGTLTGLERKKARIKAVEFVKKLYNSSIDKIGIENPVGVLSTYFRKPDQVIQPYEYGDDASKKNMPLA